jgi:hypothetical protein
MSSVLRSLDSQNLPCPTMRVLQELSTPDQFSEFLQVAQSIFQRECKLVYENTQYNSILKHSLQKQTQQSFGSLKDGATQGINMMLTKIVNYMIKNRMID